ncbi:FHA domain-containing protein [Leptolyngbya sp. AN03gr2]|uniref:FHA domain-containing protein n=1 Tax=unclassified Leptolyngbya TaxID=2650499 RepID=UPI003D317705
MTSHDLNPAMIPWKSYVQFAALRSRQLISQRVSERSDDDIPTAIDCRPHLVLHLPDGMVHFWLQNQQNWRIGRSTDCDIVLSDHCVSRYHAAIQLLEPGEFYLVDLNSYNGSFINDRRVREISRLHSGDRLSFGQVELEFYDGTPQFFKNAAVTAEPKLQSNTPAVR